MTRSVVAVLWTLCLISSIAPRSIALAQSGSPRTDFSLLAESVGWDGVLVGLLSTFDKADVLALGEAHGRRVDSDLRVRLIQHPEFAKKVRVIVVEFGAPSLQPLIDRYISGDDVLPLDAQQLWVQNSVREESYNAVRDVNQNLPLGLRIRVLGVGLPDSSASNESALTALRNEVLSRNEKALVVYGSGHLWHGHGGITTALDQQFPGRIFVAETLAPVPGIRPSPALDALNNSLQSFETQLQSTGRPVLVSMRGTSAARLAANPFYLGQAMLRPMTTIGDLDDAIVYFGSK